MPPFFQEYPRLNPPNKLTYPILIFTFEVDDFPFALPVGYVFLVPLEENSSTNFGKEDGPKYVQTLLF